MKKYLVIIALTFNVVALLLALLSVIAFFLLHSFAIPLVALALGVAALAIGSIISTCITRG